MRVGHVSFILVCTACSIALALGCTCCLLSRGKQIHRAHTPSFLVSADCNCCFLLYTDYLFIRMNMCAKICLYVTYLYYIYMDRITIESNTNTLQY